MILEDQPQETLQKMCGWCHRVMSDGEERFARGAKARPESQSLFRGNEGLVVVVGLADGNRQILAIVPKADSPARKHGHDVIFQTCSTTCADALEKKLRDEMRSPG